MKTEAPALPALALRLRISCQAGKPGLGQGEIFFVECSINARFLPLVEMTEGGTKECRGGVHPRPREGIKPSPTQHLVGTIEEGSKGQGNASVRP
ncbi:MAG: hypothetical protein JRF69_04050 [Deltaproteobacteria bacterium]|nr:hypothetical protein [Deltaproteobacteria bacterium]